MTVLVKGHTDDIHALILPYKVFYTLHYFMSMTQE